MLTEIKRELRNVKSKLQNDDQDPFEMLELITAIR